ncbi:unnamed protein product [Notodromas monacha]|uniref:Phospholipid/glycerol acyltransferase domain-containing protein n=1 Tax=Notodromas monacha TaxID=399045 RepID=A0A7R9BGF3_9CRUS|nr:unnamed protein product [Notodromas monacha]CAG0913403.1 unnamed protein product [Notodromas monacha]
MPAVVARLKRFVRSAFFNVVWIPSVAVVLAGSAPPYIVAWVVWRGATAFLPKWVYQVGDDFLYFIYQNCVLFFFEYMTGVQVLVDGDYKEIFSKKENAIYLGNHQSTVDWVLSNMVAVRQGSLGNLRYVMKSSLQQIPLYGLYFYEHGCIYVNRGNFDPEKMIAGLSYLRHPRINTWMVVFPEGTRYGLARKPRSTSNAIDNSAPLQLAAQQDGNLPDVKKEGSLRTPKVELKHHLTPKSRGTWLALQTLRQQTNAVYSASVVYDGCIDETGKRRVAPQILGFLRRESKWIYIHLKRIPIDEVPSREADFQAWLDDLFTEKDKLIGDFFSPDAETRSRALARGKPARSHLAAAIFGLVTMAAISIPFFLSSAGKALYWKVTIFGSLIGYSRLALAAVA